ncbi:hypothetical protein ES703_73078 [subsurface metagenome]
MKFVELTIKATQDEIIERIEQLKGGDYYFDYHSSLFFYLDFEHAEPYLEDEPDPEDMRER